MSSAAAACRIRLAAARRRRFSWRSWPLEEGGLSAWLLSVVAVTLIVAVGLSTGQADALVACGILSAAAWRFFVPTHFELMLKAFLKKCSAGERRIAWRTFETSEICREGVFLRPAGGSLSLFRGLYLPWGAHQAEVFAFVDYYLGQAGPSRTRLQPR